MTLAKAARLLDLKDFPVNSVNDHFIEVARKGLNWIPPQGNQEEWVRYLHELGKAIFETPSHEDIGAHIYLLGSQLDKAKHAKTIQDVIKELDELIY